jgi:hypothetical protein
MCGGCVGLTTLPTSVIRLYRQCGIHNISQPYRPQQSVEVEVNLRPTVSRPVRLGIGPPCGTLDQILSCSFFLLTIT